MELWMTVFGRLRAGQAGAELSFRSNKIRALLAYLAVEADRAHPRTRLASLLWPGWPDEVALRNLRLSLSRLNHTLAGGPVALRLVQDTVQLAAPAGPWLDWAEFERGLAVYTQHAHPAAACPECAPPLEQAVRQHHGSFLEGLALTGCPDFEEWVLVKRELSQQRALDALAALAAYQLDRGAYAAAQSYAQQQLALEPWRELAHQQLMLALARAGRRDEALARYAICRRVLQAELGVEPTLATRRLAAQLHAGETAWLEPAAEPEAAAPARLLVIDDDPPLAGALGAVLRRAGYQVTVVNSGAEALRRVREAPPDLIVCDVMMPAPDGWEVRRRLNDQAWTAQIPFIFLTARAGQPDKIAGLRAGADDYITKPFDVDELLLRVQALLRRAVPSKTA